MPNEDEIIMLAGLQSRLSSRIVPSFNSLAYGIEEITIIVSDVQTELGYNCACGLMRPSSKQHVQPNLCEYLPGRNQTIYSSDQCMLSECHMGRVSVWSPPNVGVPACFRILCMVMISMAYS